MPAERKNAASADCGGGGKKSYELPFFVVAVFVQKVRAVAPALLDLDVARQKDFAAQKLFHILAGEGEHLFERGALFADEDRLMVWLFSHDV